MAKTHSPYYYTFGSSLPTRSWSDASRVYRYGFNGKEKDSEGMGGGSSTYDYGFRIYNPSLGRFLSVDPLYKKYAWLSSYQFASNIPISAIDIDGLESKIIIQERKSDGTVVITSTTEYTTAQVPYLVFSGKVARIEYKTVDVKGPLGAGTYTVTKNIDGTFNEVWTPDQGNPVDAFSQDNVSGDRWIDNTQKDAKMMFMNRLNGRLVEASVEDMIYNEQLSLISNPTQDQKISLSKEVKANISVLETDNIGLKGKFATFITKKVAEKYTKNWVKKSKDINSKESKASGHKSNYEYIGPEYGSSNYCPKYYDGDFSSTDDVGMQIGIVKEGWFDHGMEAASVLVGEKIGNSTNLGAENAKKLMEYICNLKKEKKD